MITIVDKIFNKTKRLFKVDIESLSAKEYFEENKRHIESRHNYDAIIDTTIEYFKKNGGTFNGFALTESSIRSFFYNLLKNKKPEYYIVELGGGQSTFFLNDLSDQINIRVVTYEHDAEWAKIVQDKLAHNKKIQIHYSPLKKLDDHFRSDIFSTPHRAKDVWDAYSENLPGRASKNYFLKNGFYDIQNESWPDKKIDGLIVDGPHGNGRSICFPLFYNLIQRGTIVMIDDYHHYPFLDDAAKVFTYEVIEQRIYKYSNKGWTVLKILAVAE
jgi:hypothetical protein